MRWMQIAIKPAKPFAFGLLGAGDRHVPVFGLPGNPVTSLVSFELFARPALRQMMGHADLDRADGRWPSPTTACRRRPDGKTHFVRVIGAFGDDGRVPRRARSAPRAATSWRPPPLANALAVCPTATASPPAATSPSCCWSDPAA